jgi:hypothetical protein
MFALPVLTAGICLAGTARASVILNETFPANQRLTQDWPATSTWYVSGLGSGSVEDSTAGALRIAGASNTWTTLTYFTGSASPATLGVGDSLKLTLSFEVQKQATSGDNTLRIALLNSGGKRLSADATASQIATFSAYTGYYVNVRPTLPDDSSATFGLSKRTGTSNYLLTSAYTTVPASSGGGTTASSSNSLKPDTLYSFEVTYTRTSANALNVSVAMSGAGLDNYTYAFNDTSSPFTAFDTFAIGSTNGTTFNSVTLHSLGITLTSIPEPGVTGAVLGGGGLVAFLLIRRRH